MGLSVSRHPDVHPAVRQLESTARGAAYTVHCSTAHVPTQAHASRENRESSLDEPPHANDVQVHRRRRAPRAGRFVSPSPLSRRVSVERDPAAALGVQETIHPRRGSLSGVRATSHPRGSLRATSHPAEPPPQESHHCAPHTLLERSSDARACDGLTATTRPAPRRSAERPRPPRAARNGTESRWRTRSPPWRPRPAGG
jgi:hypothetical protein